MTPIELWHYYELCENAMSPKLKCHQWETQEEILRRLKREAAMTKSAILHIDGIGQIDAGTMNTAQQILAAAKESEEK
jgi:ribose 1,5-bisphosphokinase PhnN